ncbi:MAG: YggS family pyridoxal phosphate-dependent enzyme [Lactovum sp.]
MILEKNLAEIQVSMRKAEKEAGRLKNSVQLIAVTKYSDSELTRKFVEIGIKELAENRVDKLLEKQKALSDLKNIRWHFIGNLQRRKVKSVINSINCFHALDSLKLAKEISKYASHKISCLLEVNISGEKSKLGFLPEELEQIVKEISLLENIEIIGLMTMSPLNADEETITKIFQTAKQLKEKIKEMNLPNIPCTELSMGMSSDYKIAIKQGATMIRIGRDFLKSEIHLS